MKRESLGFASGMFLGMARSAAAGGSAMNQFDWEKAKQIIVDRRDEIDTALAGLQEDWGCTCGEIFCDDGFVSPEDCYAYACSKWASPMLLLHLKDGSEDEIDCGKSVPSEEAISGMPDGWDDDDAIIDCRRHVCPDGHEWVSPASEEKTSPCPTCGKQATESLVVKSFED